MTELGFAGKNDGSGFDIKGTMLLTFELDAYRCEPDDTDEADGAGDAAREGGLDVVVAL